MAGILPNRLKPFKNCAARLLASDRFRRGLGAGCSFPEWIPRASAAALEKTVVSISRRRGRELYERLLRSHQLVIIRRTVFVVAFVPHDACKSLLNELFGYVAGDRVKGRIKLIISRQLTLLDSLHGSSRIRAHRIHPLEAG